MTNTAQNFQDRFNQNIVSLGGLQELPVNVEQLWPHWNPEKTSVTVKYTDKRKFEEITKEFKEQYPQIYFDAKVEQMTIEMEKLKNNNKELKAETDKVKKDFEAKFEKMTKEIEKVTKNNEDLQAKFDQMTSSKTGSFFKYFGKNK